LDKVKQPCPWNFHNTASLGKGRGTRLILLFSLTAVPIDECFCSNNWMSLNREVRCG
jgi:hypothetical protein